MTYYLLIHYCLKYGLNDVYIGIFNSIELVENAKKIYIEYIKKNSPHMYQNVEVDVELCSGETVAQICDLNHVFNPEKIYILFKTSRHILTGRCLAIRPILLTNSFDKITSHRKNKSRLSDNRRYIELVVNNIHYDNNMRNRF